MPAMYIMIGLPGSGKSTAAQELVHWSHICSADNYFLTQGIGFDPTQIEAAHRDCYQQVLSLVRRREDVVVDNTNLRAEHREPYLQLAKNGDIR